LKWAPLIEVGATAAGRGQHAEPERERHADVPDAEVSDAGGQDRAAAAAEHQPAGAEELRGEPLHGRRV
jgi:hypothetical protein